jgi:hypothetical protein
VASSIVCSGAVQLGILEVLMRCVLGPRMADAVRLVINKGLPFYP